MKKITLSCLALAFAINFSCAQQIGTSPIYYSGNNVGIGTATPAALLDVGQFLSSGSVGSILARLSEGSGQGAGTYLGITGYDTQPTPNNTDLTSIKSFAIEHSFYGITNSSINFLRGGGESGGSISFSTNNNVEKMRILYNGNVGIGITNPQNKLDVNGTVHAKQVTVDMNGWSDFVFNATYNLPALADVKTYIAQNHHLPDMPSETEVIKDGINLGEMNKLLTKKVEELTLYLIEQNKQIVAQQQVNEDDKSRLNAQQAEIDQLKDVVAGLVKKVGH